jgi:carbon monoxide dehydrogenase subunit G
MARYEHSIDVNVPLETAYNQWTQFEEFPRFMEGVKSVTQITDTRLHWVAEIAGKEREWDAEITEQKPDSRIAWHSISGAQNAGVVTFHYIDRDTTRVMLQMELEPEGLVENVGAALGIVQRRISGDLERFKDFIEAKGFETGAWRGKVERFPEQQGSSGSRYSENAVESSVPIGTGPVVYDAVANGSADPNSISNRDHETISTFSSGAAGEVSSATQSADYGISDERGQRNGLGDDTFISSGEGDGSNNGGGGIPNTDTREGSPGSYGGSAGGTAYDEHGQTATANGSDPRLYNDDISRGMHPGEEPAHGYGAVEDEPQNEGWEDDSMRANTPPNLR